MNLMDFGLPLGRQFRVLKLWFTMRALGRQGVQRLIRHHVELAQRLASAIRKDHRFELTVPVSFTTVCFRYCGTDAENEAILADMLADGSCLLSATQLNGRFALRIAVGNSQTEWHDVEECWRLIQRLAPAHSVIVQARKEKTS